MLMNKEHINYFYVNRVGWVRGMSVNFRGTTREQVLYVPCLQGYMDTDAFERLLMSLI